VAVTAVAAGVVVVVVVVVVMVVVVVVVMVVVVVVAAAALGYGEGFEHHKILLLFRNGDLSNVPPPETSQSTPLSTADRRGSFPQPELDISP
jgi:hypothetical protein